jgi:hypothetical protein
MIPKTSLPYSQEPTKWIQSTTYFLISLKSILILSPHLYLVLQNDAFPSEFLTKMFINFLSLPACYIPRLCHPLLFDLHNNIWRKVQIMKLLFMYLFYPRVTFFRSCPNILSNTVHLCFFPMMSETKFQVPTKKGKLQFSVFWSFVYDFRQQTVICVAANIYRIQFRLNFHCKGKDLFVLN